MSESVESGGGWWRPTAEGAVIAVRARPRSSRSIVDGVVGDALAVRVRSAPVDGKANRELAETLADAFGIAKSRVRLVAGDTAKTKRFLLAGVDAPKLPL